MHCYNNVDGDMMEQNEIDARREFFNWFEINVCKSHEYDYNNVDPKTVKMIETKMDQLLKKYNLNSIEVFEGVLYDIEKRCN